MDPDTPREPAMPGRSAAAFAVHIFTACGAGCSLLALIAAVNGQWAAMFVWLGIALCIDGVDGTFARRLEVAKLLPRWSGDVLDLVVDILNYVFVPAYALAASGLLPKPAAVPLGLLIVVTGALYFADRLMKTSDYYFRGFPALWNVAAFYLFVLKPDPWAGAAAIIALAALTFVPFHVVHPVRITHLRGVTMVALAAWAMLAIVAVAQDLNPPLWIAAALCALAVYFVAIGFFRRHHP
ncbi:MAG: phosphatidylcholine synthase [Rhizobiales bacterium]|nr:phosphatidylcholine synthase [Hyphomicrobiales bacterium]